MTDRLIARPPGPGPAPHRSPLPPAALGVTSPDPDSWGASAAAPLSPLGGRIPSEGASRLDEVLATLPEVGDDFLGFRIVGELGRGAFGRVFLARQGDLADRFVALKV